MTLAYRRAEVSTVTRFEYTSMVLAIIVGYVISGDVPTPFMLTGGVIVVLAGLFIIVCERRLEVAARAG
jgi:drug/metabolite transporter (DMT)-like permease